MTWINGSSLQKTLKKLCKDLNFHEKKYSCILLAAATMRIYRNLNTRPLYIFWIRVADLLNINSFYKKNQMSK